MPQRAIEAKRLMLAGEAPANELAVRVWRLSDELAARAPAYLRPPASQWLVTPSDSCLAILEVAVKWEAEKLDGLEAPGPFAEL